MSKTLKKVKSERKNICVRFSESEREELEQRAEEYNVKLSEWIRTAALSWRPSEEDVIEDKKLA